MSMPASRSVFLVMLYWLCSPALAAAQLLSTCVNWRAERGLTSHRPIALSQTREWLLSLVRHQYDVASVDAAAERQPSAIG